MMYAVSPKGSIPFQVPLITARPKNNRLINSSDVQETKIVSDVQERRPWPAKMAQQRTLAVPSRSGVTRIVYSLEWRSCRTMRLGTRNCISITSGVQSHKATTAKTHWHRRQHILVGSRLGLRSTTLGGLPTTGLADPAQPPTGELLALTLLLDR